MNEQELQNNVRSELTHNSFVSVFESIRLCLFDCNYNANLCRECQDCVWDAQGGEREEMYLL